MLLANAVELGKYVHMFKAQTKACNEGDNISLFD
jgi:hypothetical protein